MKQRRLHSLIAYGALLLGTLGPGSLAAQGAGDDLPANVDAAFQYAMARLLASDGDQAGAEAAFRSAIEADREAAFLHVEFASFLLQLRRVDEASAQAAEARRLAPEDSEALRTFGLVEFERARALRRPDLLLGAAEALESLRRVDSSDLQGMLALGQIYQLRGELDRAVGVYEELLSHHADNDRLKRLVIDTLGQAGESERARSLLEELVRLDRDALDSRLTLAEVESSKGNHQGAIEVLEGASEQDFGAPNFVFALALEYLLSAESPELTPDQREAALSRAESLADTMLAGESRPEALRLKAQLALVRKQTAQAVELLKEATAAEPEDPRAAIDLADLWIAEHQVDEAAAVLAELLDSHGRDAQVQRLLVQRFGALEDWRGVLEVVEKALRESEIEDRQRVFLVSSQVDALVALDRVDEALSVLATEAKSGGASPFYSFRQAELLLDRGRTREAVRVLTADRLAELDVPELVIARARLLFRAERDGLAFEALDRMVAADPGAGALQAGQFLTSLERFGDAVRYFRQGIAAIDAETEEEVLADAHFLLGATYERSGENEQAAEQFKTVLELRQDDSDAMNYLGYMWADQGVNLDEALRLVQRAVELQPSNGSYIDSLGWAQYRLGQYQAARESLERAADLTPNNATIHDHLGDVYRALGEIGLAREAYQKALSLDDAEDPVTIQDKLQQLEAGAPRQLP